ncbi:hypothetical protein [Paraburkholderia sp. GAS32]|uniref:hypothetical protein n=1 Tax=Paraburkholderia sp. GAS32 TaxID=3035129 RepID=UPI003D1AFE11
MAASHPKLNFRDHDRIVPAIKSIHTPDVAGGNTLLTAAANDDMLVGSIAAGAGKNFRTDNVSIATVVRHIGFRLGYTRKHYPEPLRTC